MNKLRKLIWLLQSAQLGAVATLVRRWLYSDASGVGLQRGLDTPIAARRPRHPLTIRPIRPDEQAPFASTNGVRGNGAIVRVNARYLFATEIETCYVALIDGEVPCYIQYLVFPDQNDRFATAFGEPIPPLAPGEALLEFAFTLEQYRALGVMPFAVSELAKEASLRGAERLVTWVPEWNPHVRRYMERVGFEPFAIRRERYRFFRRRVWFERTDGSTWAQAGTPSQK